MNDIVFQVCAKEEDAGANNRKHLAAVSLVLLLMSVQCITLKDAGVQSEVLKHTVLLFIFVCSVSLQLSLAVKEVRRAFIKC